MTGFVKFFLGDKGYGFISGDDGKDYYFHINDIQDRNEKIEEGSHLTFDSKVTPKGYSAVKCKITENKRDSESQYQISHEIQLTREPLKSLIDKPHVLDIAGFTIYGSGRGTPDGAKEDLKNNLSRIGANYGIGLEYFSTTGSESGTGRGTHHFTIHNFMAIPAVVGKRCSKGGVTRSQIYGELEERCLALRSELVWEFQKELIKAFFAIIVILAILYFCNNVLFVDAQSIDSYIFWGEKTTDPLTPGRYRFWHNVIGGIFILVALRYPTRYYKWLQKF